MAAIDEYGVWMRMLFRAAQAFFGLVSFAIPAGFLLALAGYEALGLALLLGGTGILFLAHLAMGIVGYRHVMRRPWPKVEPLDDDDDW